MKKLCWLILLIGLVSCSKDENAEPQQAEHTARIEQIWALNSPVPLYVMRLSDGRNVCMTRFRYNHDLYQGDVIRYELSAIYPNEIIRINDCETGCGNDATAGNDYPNGSLIASDPIEADVLSVFEMKWRHYGLTMFLLPINSYFIETPERLIYVRESKLNIRLRPGDRIVYNVYTIFPHEVLATKKLN